MAKGPLNMAALDKVFAKFGPEYNSSGLGIKQIQCADCVIESTLHCKQ